MAALQAQPPHADRALPTMCKQRKSEKVEEDQPVSKHAGLVHTNLAMMPPATRLAPPTRGMTQPKAIYLSMECFELRVAVVGCTLH